MEVSKTDWPCGEQVMSALCESFDSEKPEGVSWWSKDVDKHITSLPAGAEVLPHPRGQGSQSQPATAIEGEAS